MNATMPAPIERPTTRRGVAAVAGAIALLTIAAACDSGGESSSSTVLEPSTTSLTISTDELGPRQHRTRHHRRRQHPSPGHGR